MEKYSLVGWSTSESILGFLIGAIWVWLRWPFGVIEQILFGSPDS